MFDRRGHARFAADSDGYCGEFELFDNAILKTAQRDRAVIVCDVAATRGEVVAVDLGANTTLPMRVVDSRPVVIDGRLRCRLTLQLLSEAEETEARQNELAAPTL